MKPTFHPARRGALLSCFVFVLTTGACAPVLVGVAASGGGGSGGTTTAEPPEAAALGLRGDLADDHQTCVSFMLRQAAGRPCRFYLEYRKGSGPWTKVSDQQVQRIPAVGQSAVAYPFQDQAQRQWRDSSGKLGQEVTYYLVWDHRAELGATEVAGVGLRLRLQDADSKDAPAEKQIGSSSNVLGRDNGVLSGLAIERVTTNDLDGGLKLVGTLTDAGCDTSTITARYACVGDDGVERWRPLTPTQTTPGTDCTAPVTIAFDPIADGVDRGFYRVKVEVTNFETFASGDRRRNTVPDLPARTYPAVERADLQIGVGPTIDSVKLTDPVSFVAPIVVEVANNSTRGTPVTLRLSGRFALGAPGGIEMGNATLLDTANPGTSDTITLPRQTRRFVTLRWDARRDLGLGANSGAGAPETVGMTVTARVLVLGLVPTRAVQAIGTTDSTSVVQTSPFFDAATRLTGTGTPGVPDDAYELDANFQNRPDGRQQLFVRRHQPNTSANVNQIVVDQQFDPRPILGLQPYLFSVPVSDVIPTAFDSNPNCLVRANYTQLTYLRFPVTGTPTPLANISINGNISHTFTAVPAQFTLPNGNPGVLFLTWDSGPSYTLHMYAIVRDLTSGTFYQNTLNLTRSVPARAASVFKMYLLSGQFDTDPATATVVVGAPGTAYDQSSSFFEVVKIRQRAVGNPWEVDFETGATIPALRLPSEPALNPTTGFDPLARWFLSVAPNPTDASRPGLLLARQVNGDSVSPKRFQAFTLAQGSNGFAGQTWTAVSSIRTPVGPWELENAYSRDLDGDQQSDLLLAFFESGVGTYQRRRLRLDLLANRAELAQRWRQLPDILIDFPRVNDPETYALADVNGDGFEDLIFFAGFPQLSTNHNREFSYLTNTAVGATRATPLSLSNRPGGGAIAACESPSAMDLDGDGFTDLLSGGLMWQGKADGTYAQIGNATGDTGASYWIEQIFAPGVERSTEIDVLHLDRLVGGSQRTNLNTVFGYSGLLGARNSPRTPPLRTSNTQWAPLTLSAGDTVALARPFLPPNRTGPGTAKDLAAILRNTGTAALWRLVYDPANQQFRKDRELQANTTLLAVARAETVPVGSDLRRNTLVQDLFTALRDGGGADRTRVWWLSAGASPAYTPRALSVTSGSATESIYDLTAASASNTACDALLVMTVDRVSPNWIVRAYRLEQDCSLGIAGDRFHSAGTNEIVMQFEVIPRNPIGFAGDAFASTLGEAAVVMDTEVRLLFPNALTGIMRMIRAPLDIQPTSVGVSMFDLDSDGRADVLLGIPGTSGADVRLLKRSVRN